jgi:hypothetical protein
LLKTTIFLREGRLGKPAWYAKPVPDWEEVHDGGSNVAAGQYRAVFGSVGAAHGYHRRQLFQRADQVVTNGRVVLRRFILMAGGVPTEGSLRLVGGLHEPTVRLQDNLAARNMGVYVWEERHTGASPR